MIVAAVINFGVKNQVLQVSFKFVVGDFISFHTLGYYMNLFVSDMILFGYYLILFCLIFKFQEPSVMLVVGLINFCVTNQVPQVFFKFDVSFLL